jgi:hypothetical protein
MASPFEHPQILEKFPDRPDRGNSDRNRSGDADGDGGGEAGSLSPQWVL